MKRGGFGPQHHGPPPGHHGPPGPQYGPPPGHHGPPGPHHGPPPGHHGPGPHHHGPPGFGPHPMGPPHHGMRGHCNMGPSYQGTGTTGVIQQPYQPVNPQQPYVNNVQPLPQTSYNGGQIPNQMNPQQPYVNNVQPVSQNIPGIQNQQYQPPLVENIISNNPQGNINANSNAALL